MNLWEMSFGHQRLLFITCFLACSVFFAYGEKAEPFTAARFHLSDAEWSYVEDARIPAEKLQAILAAGVKPSEYFRYPWLSAGMSEPDWLSRRQAGLIREEKEYCATDINKWTIVQNFFFPGLHQFGRHQIRKGFLMSGLAIFSLGLYAILKDPRRIGSRGFDYPECLILYGAGSFWSSIDIGMQLSREANPTAQRFSLAPGKAGDTISFTYLNEAGLHVSNVPQW